jgi:uncharacterized protein
MQPPKPSSTNELKDSGVTVTTLMPGATDTNFFDRSGLNNTKVGAGDNKDDPAAVARLGFDSYLFEWKCSN